MLHDTLTTNELIAAAAGVLFLLGAVLLGLRRLTADDAAPEAAGQATAEGLLTPVLAASSHLARFANGLAVGTLMALTKFLPKSEKLWYGVAKRGFRGMYKTSIGKADAIGIIDRANGIDLKPVKWKRGDPDDPTSPPRWVTKGGEEWHAGNEGRETELLGNVPVILLDEDAETVGSFLQSRFQAALDLGQKDQLFVPERVEQIVVEVDGHAAAEGGPEAIADGGAITNETIYEIPDAEWPDKLADVLVDLSAPNGEAGMRVSAKQYKEVYQEKVGSEEMQMQELRGRAAEADPNKAKEMLSSIMKWVLLAILAARSPELLAMLMGSGVGDAMGDAVPTFTIMPPVWQLLAAVPF